MSFSFPTIFIPLLSLAPQYDITQESLMCCARKTLMPTCVVLLLFVLVLT